MKRLLTAVCLALFALYSIFYAPQSIFMVIAALMGCLCYQEFSGIAAASGVRGVLWIGYFAGVFALFRPDSVPLIALLLLIASLRCPELKDSLAFAAVTLLGTVYVFLPWRWAAALRVIDPRWLFYALSVNWVGDAAAFYVGRSLGRNKLAPSVSPAKSWEGAIGSFVVTILYGIALGHYWKLGLGVTEMAALSAVTNAAGQVGDLAESALKRGAGLKDSGTLLPGHGGFLDRLDSSLFTLPVVYFALLWSRQSA